MNEDKITIAELCDLARAALTHNDFEDSAIAAFEDYCKNFNEWQAHRALEKELATSLESSETAVLAQLHDQILKRAETLFRATAGQLQNFQIKAKGIMAYVDILPKKISVTKHRKG